MCGRPAKVYIKNRKINNMSQSKLDLILEDYSEENYPELQGEKRVALGLEIAVLGIEERSKCLVYDYDKALEFLKGVSKDEKEAVEKLTEVIVGFKDCEYKPIWAKGGRDLDKIKWVSEMRYPQLANKYRFPTGLDGAIIGFDEESLRCIYSCHLCILCLMSNDGMSYDDAREFLEFNSFCCYDAAEYQPIWCDDMMVADLELDSPTRKASV